MFLHESEEVLRGVARQCRLTEMWIGGEKVFRPAMQIREIAATAARDQNLFPERPRRSQTDTFPPPFPCSIGQNRPAAPAPCEMNADESVDLKSSDKVSGAHIS